MNDKELLELLNKYPFLKYRNVFSDELCYKTDEENLKHNYYVYWNGSGWEKLWKKYLEKLFWVYDNKWTDKEKEAFRFMEIKEKFGQLRIYTSFEDSRFELETKAEMLSGLTCQKCGKEPINEKGQRIIWQTKGWITNLCKECAVKYLEKKESKNIEKDLKEMEIIYNEPFSYTSFSKEGKKTVTFKEVDGWLEKE